MNIYYVGYENIDYGGRSLELIKVLSQIGHFHGVIMGSSGCVYEKQLTLVDPQSSYKQFIALAKKDFKKHGLESDLLFVDTRKAALTALLFGKKIKKMNIIYDMRELRIPSEIKSLSSRLGCFPEKKIMEMSKLVICANKERAEYVNSHFKVRKTTVFENIRKIDYSICEHEEEYSNKYKNIFTKNSFKIIATCGTSLLRGNDKLVEAVIRCNGFPVDLLLVGGEFGEKGSYDVIKSIVDKNKANNIHIIDKVKSEELIFLINNCDCGVVNYSNADTNNRFCASGKIYEFVFAKKPVITTSNPPLKRLVDEYKIGCSGDDFYGLIKDMVENFENYKKNVELFIKDLSIEKNNEQLSNDIRAVLMES